MAIAVNQGATGNQDIDGVLSGVRWSGTVTYSFPDSPSDYPTPYTMDNEPLNDFAQVSAQQQVVIQSIMQQIMNYTNLTITFAGFNSADIRLAHSDAANPTSYAYYPSNSASGAGGDVWFGDEYDYSNPIIGTYEYATHIHEIGHSFGLSHGHEDGVGGLPLPANHDSLEYSVMTYRSYVGGPIDGYSNGQFGFPQTYMMSDIAALQTMYGADYTYHAGNNVYSWNPGTGTTFIDGAAMVSPGGNRIFLTIWDGGGVDTYDFSAYSTSVTIDLTPGGYSIGSQAQLAYLGDGNYAHGNIYNAYLFQGNAGSYIENAVGGSGGDFIFGNAIANSLTGGAGNDTIDGGGGTDSAVFSGLRSAYTLTALSGNGVRVTGPDGTDTLTNVELLVFSDQTVTWPLVASAFDLTASNIGFDGTAVSYHINNIGTGTAGASTTGIYLSTDSTITTSDTLLTTVSTPSLAASASDNESVAVPFPTNLTPGTYYIGAIADYNAQITEGNEANNATSGVPVILGNNSANTLTGTSGNDTIIALGGDDILIGLGGNNRLDGGTGTNTADYTAAPAAVTVNLLAGIATNGYGGTDTLINIQNVTGSALGDTITGSAIDNVLTGGLGNDTLIGGLGNDIMIGGLGDDIYYVDSLSDTVTEGVGAGTDTVVTFVSGITLAANIEQGVVATTTAQTLTGNSLNNVLLGNAGNDTLIGGDGNDTLNGRVGNDTMIGGIGDDIYGVDSLSDTIIEGVGAGTDAVATLISGYTLAANIETGVVYTATAQTLTGNSLNNTLLGNNGNDTLIGAGGNDIINGALGDDTMVGGTGNDVYAVDSLSDTVIELVGEGTDTIYTYISGVTLAANVENGTVWTATGQTLTGNGLDNFLTGNSGSDVLNGADGNDTLDGRAGIDILTGGIGNDTFAFTSGQANSDIIMDFVGNGAAAGDQLRFSGYGTLAQGASFVQLDATRWQINSSDGLVHDVITFQNAASINASDFIFI